MRNEKGTTHQPLASVCVCMHTHNHSQAHVQTHKNMHTVCSGLNTTDQTPAAAHNSGWAGLGLCLSLHTCLPPGPLSNCRCKFASRLAQHPRDLTEPKMSVASKAARRKGVLYSTKGCFFLPEELGALVPLTRLSSEPIAAQGASN